MTAFVYVNTSKQVGDPEHIKVFANVDAAEKWFEKTIGRSLRVLGLGVNRCLPNTASGERNG
ncbi:hypothetical protein [Bradyrhizobium sp. sGM-13]|uniref:hypothetical protein n=1 Tax=Bradyrhizobium sp. sGM-13 TaxID=2831781 RepID=UPI001BD0AF1A|nr:hypothetical protein [Bradyrhizobium sp. sGM-13]